MKSRPCIGSPLRAFVLIALVLGGCSRQPPPPKPEFVAKVGAREITVADFQDWMRRRGVSTNVVQKEALLTEVVDHYAAVEKARTLGLDRDPELQRAWEHLLVNALRERQLESQFTNAQPSPELVRAWYESNLVTFSEPAQRRAAILFAELPAKSTPAQREAALRRLTEARGKALEAPGGQGDVRGFGPLAVQYSDDPLTRYKGGDTGWIIEGKSDYRFDPAILGAVFSLPQTNALSEVLETPRGFYLVKLTDLRPRRVKPLEAVQAAIQQRLLAEDRRRRERAWNEQLRAGLKIETNLQLLPSIPAAANAVPLAAPNPPSLP